MRLRRGENGGLPRILSEAQWTLLGLLAQGDLSVNAKPRDERVGMNTVNALVDRDLAALDDHTGAVRITPMGHRLLGCEASARTVASSPAGASASSYRPLGSEEPLKGEAIPTPEEMRRRITDREDPLVAELTEKILKAIDLEWDMGPEPVFVPLGRKEVPKRVERMLKDQFAAKAWSLDYGTAAAESGGGTERTVTATSIVGSQR